MNQQATRKTSVLLIFGGASTEHEISCISAGFVDRHINREKYDVLRMGITRSGAWYLYNGPVERIIDDTWSEDTENCLPAILSPCPVHHGIMVLNKPESKYSIIRVDCAFPVMHGKNGEDGTLQGLLTLSGIPFTGCGTLSSAVCMDKATTKLICEQEGIKTAPFLIARNSPDFDCEAFADKSERQFGYPVFVKPANSGSSVGITKAADREQLINGFATAFANDSKLIVEKAIKGKEIEVAVFGGSQPEVSCCGEIRPDSGFYDYYTKYVNDTAGKYIPADIPDSVSESVREIAKRIYITLDCSGMSRVDFFVDGENIVFNEINTIPGFTGISMYPKLMEYSGKSPDELVEGIIALANERK